MNNRERLFDLIVRYSLDRRDVAELLSVTRETVDHWLQPHGTGHAEEAPTMAVELLEYKVKDRDAKPLPVASGFGTLEDNESPFHPDEPGLGLPDLEL
jgi:hypothetical protein